MTQEDQSESFLGICYHLPMKKLGLFLSGGEVRKMSAGDGQVSKLSERASWREQNPDAEGKRRQKWGEKV